MNEDNENNIQYGKTTIIMYSDGTEEIHNGEVTIGPKKKDTKKIISIILLIAIIITGVYLVSHKTFSRLGEGYVEIFNTDGSRAGKFYAHEIDDVDAFGNYISISTTDGETHLFYGCSYRVKKFEEPKVKTSRRTAVTTTEEPYVYDEYGYGTNDYGEEYQIGYGYNYDPELYEDYDASYYEYD